MEDEPQEMWAKLLTVPSFQWKIKKISYWNPQFLQFRLNQYTFATIRLRTHKTRGHLSREMALAMVFKLAQSSEKRWNRIHRYKLLPKLLEGGQFVDGVWSERHQDQGFTAT